MRTSRSRWLLTTPTTVAATASHHPMPAAADLPPPLLTCRAPRVTRQVGTEEARVSRLLLCARCEYFHTFLSADFADARAVARSGVLDLSHTLPGLSRPSLLALLRFVFAG